MKLTEIDPQRLASEVEGWMERRAAWSSTALHVQGRKPPRPALADRDHQKTGVARAVVSLHLFARGDRTVTAQVAEACLRFVWRWVYAPPWMTTNEVETMGLGELRVEQSAKAPDEALALVLVAARGRLRLAQKKSVPAAEVAAMTGLTEDYLRKLAKGGELERVLSPAGGGAYSNRSVGKLVTRF